MGRTHLTHRRESKRLPTYIPLLFYRQEKGDMDAVNAHYGKYIWVLKTRLPKVPRRIVSFASNFYGISAHEARELVDPERIVGSACAWDDPDFVSEVWDEFEDVGFTTSDGAVVLDVGETDIEGPLTEDEYEEKFA